MRGVSSTAVSSTLAMVLLRSLHPSAQVHICGGDPVSGPGVVRSDDVAMAMAKRRRSLMVAVMLEVHERRRAKESK